ncbi:phosphatase PAP2 family protein [Actinomadura flavalba]|uniref:phosphatase PAP2 family protein n=1 Tax=Actinomadura flavalba TaxID=1120938 RepID=UPI0003602D8D|nr:phosphatase PAP2 family protein [Actinomadura flavalba]
MQVLRTRDGRRTRAPSRTSVIAAAAVLAAVLAVLTTADVLAGGALRRFDAWTFASGLPPRTGVRHMIWRTIVNGGQYWIVGSLTALAALYAAWRDRAPGVAVRAALWLVTALAATRGAQYLFARTPPLDGRDALFQDGFLSYPSGHAANAAGCLLMIAVLLRASRRWTAAAAVLAAAVAVATVTLGYHWPTDALAGWALGTALGCAGALLVPGRSGEPGE